MANIRTNQDLLKLLYNLKSDDSCIKNELATKKESLISEKDDCTKKLTEESESLSELNSNQKAVEVGPNEAEKWLGEFAENKDLQRFFELMEVNFDISVIREKILKAEDIDTLKERINSDISRTTNEIESLRKYALRSIKLTCDPKDNKIHLPYGVMVQQKDNKLIIKIYNNRPWF